ncbi:heterokaryon incompatibility protein [Paramyrothecium foliicola]|nr:heterokaryon incompatibility protein [Paramyrothecium foliicola]
MESADCVVCKQIQNFFRDPDGAPTKGLELGIFAQLVRDAACAEHPRLLRELFDLTTVGVVDESETVTLVYHGYYPTYFPALRLGNGPAAPTRLLSVAPGQQDVSFKQAVTRHISSEWMDMELMKSRLSMCDAFHKYCGKVSHSPGLLHRPQWVVDVCNFCIVPCTPDQDYFALSYVRGSVVPLLATKENLSALQLPGALREPPFCNNLPQTILDAMLLVEWLGLKYLWIDALCIVQDDEMKQRELSRMASIYWNAEVTIIAANATSCDNGIPGLPGVSKPLTRKRPIYTIGKRLRLHSFDSLKSHRGYVASSIQQWDDRAWTLQESTFARRQIIFFDRYVAWKCNAGSRYEQVSWSRSFDFSTFSPYPYPLSQKIGFERSLPNLTDIAIAIEAFNNRNMTYPEDALDAFQGLISVLGQHCEGGFVSGIPAMFFNLGLLWQSGAVERRIARNPDANSNLPSWSWAGWKGTTRFWSYRSLSSDFCLTEPGEEARPPFYDKVTSSLQWKGHRHPQDQGVTIKSTWSQNREDYMNNLERTVPVGWIRHITDEIIDLVDYCTGERGFVYAERYDLKEDHKNIWALFEPCHYDDCQEHWTRDVMPRCFYTHESTPGKAYLFPLTIPTSDTLPVSIRMPFISCHTARAWLSAGDELRNTNSYPAISVQDENGSWVGALNVQKNLADVVTGERLELIELAQGRNAIGRKDSQKVFFEWEHPECPLNDALYEYYCVMWIERQGSICYRQGLGRILKHVWDTLPKEQIHVILG